MNAVIPPASYRRVCRSHGDTLSDGSQFRAAVIYVTNSPDQVLPAVRETADANHLEVAVLEQDRDVNLPILRERRRLLNLIPLWRSVEETWPGAYAPEQIMNVWYAAGGLVEEQKDLKARDLASGVQVLVWDPQWGVDHRMDRFTRQLGMRVRRSQCGARA